MPIFEYRCNSCDHEFEELVRAADTKVNCPKCGSRNTEKLFSAFAKASCDSCSSAGSST